MSPYHLKGRPIDQTFLWLVFGIGISMAISAQMSRMKHLLLLCIYCIWIWFLNIEYPKDSWFRPQVYPGPLHGYWGSPMGQWSLFLPWQRWQRGDTKPHGSSTSSSLQVPKLAYSPISAQTQITTKQLDLSRSTSQIQDSTSISRLCIPTKNRLSPGRKPQPSSVKDLLMSMAQELSRALLSRLEARGDGCETSPMVNTYIGYIYIYNYIYIFT